MMNVLLVDDHALFREGLAMLLHALLPNAATLHAETCAAAFDCLGGAIPVELVLLDLELPDMSGFDALARIRADWPDIPVVVLSSSEDRASVLRALDGGAMGFVPKSASSGVLEGALKVILAKGIYLPAAVFLGERNGAAPPARAPGQASAVVSCGQLGLTPRQAEVLHLVLQGMSSKAICRDLKLSLSTVKAHTSAALRALNVTTRTQAVIAAGKIGLRFAPGPAR